MIAHALQRLPPMMVAPPPTSRPVRRFTTVPPTPPPAPVPQADFAAIRRRIHVLVLEDEVALARAIAAYLSRRSMDVTLAHSLADGRALLSRHRFDFVVLDLNLGTDDGLELARELGPLRHPRVVITSSRATECDRVVGLELGADDYIVKPYPLPELSARIMAIDRRTARRDAPSVSDAVAAFDRWRVDFVKLQLTDDDGRTVSLTRGEGAILRVLVAHAQRALHRHELLALTHHDDSEVFERTIDVIVTRLRKKIERDHRNPVYIQTVRGIGYLFNVPVHRDVERRS